MQELFLPLPRHICHALQDLPYVLRKSLPMQNKHHQQLPYAIEELSTRLTSERSLMQQPYWSAPRFTAAYVWYFLPWNIIRLTRLLHGLKLPAPHPIPSKKNGELQPRIFMDMGSGPLSVPLALWFAKPEWHDIPLTILCTDISPQPLQLGQKIFENLAGKDSPWRIVTRRCQLEASISELHKLDGVPWLISAANVCNELKARQGQSMEERLEELVEKLYSTVHAPDARLLFVEPGTRLGGKTIVALREAAQEYALHPTSPCPHPTQLCPLQDSKTWCHFTFDTQGSPAWLNDLSRSAHLRKEALSLSFVLLKNMAQNSEHEEATHSTRYAQARIISAPFRVPGVRGYARYACCEEGLALLESAEHLPSGALADVYAPDQHTPVDRKSGAFILEHCEQRAYYSSESSYRPRTKTQAPTLPKKPEKTIERKEKKKVIKPSKKNEKKFWEK